MSFKRKLSCPEQDIRMKTDHSCFCAKVYLPCVLINPRPENLGCLAGPVVPVIPLQYEEVVSMHRITEHD